PDFWGRLNPAWTLCSTGRRQSPVNIEPRQLLFDPNLKPVAVTSHRVNGQLQNTGQGIVFRLSEDDHGGVNISMGPLSYRYRVYELRLHFGRTDDRGSEHSVSGFVFPAELQILGYNCDLYANVSEARQRAQGLVAVASIIKLFATRKLMQGDSFHPKAPLGNNFRPTQPLHGRVVRTNIDMRNEDCPGMQTNKFYQGKQPSAKNVTPPRSDAASRRCEQKLGPLPREASSSAFEGRTRNPEDYHVTRFKNSGDFNRSLPQPNTVVAISKKFEAVIRGESRQVAFVREGTGSAT
ncbi:hypothetical protein HPB47_025488, partial [Ixodes persulcatus]